MKTSKSSFNSFSRQQQYQPRWGREGRVTRRNPCPACQKTDYCQFDLTNYWLLCMRPEKATRTPAGWIFVKDNGKGGCLFKSDKLPGYGLPYSDVTIADLRTGPGPADSPGNNSDSSSGANQEQGSAGSSAQEEKSSEEPAPTPTPTPEPATLHKVYSSLLAALALNPRHHKELSDPEGKRRLNPDEIKAFGAKSLPSSWPAIRRVLEQLKRDYGEATLCSVPGFYLEKHSNSGGRLCLAASLGALLIPSIVDGQITGIRVRPDASGQDGPKYYWLSSAKHGGSGARVQAPVYTPLKGIKQSGIVGITEGEFKAFIAAQRLGYPFISVPGVGNWQSAGALEEARQMAGPGGLVTIFYDNDSDASTNFQVNFHKHALADALALAGLQVELAEWDGQYKGIDDLLLAGGSFRTSCHIPGLNGLRVDNLLNVPRLDYIPVDYNRKVTLIRSPRGTGKTHWLSGEIKKTISRGGRVLVAGHRVSLLKEACDRHGLEFYQNFRGAGRDRPDNRDMSKVKALAITLDSLPKLNTQSIEKIDLLVIDESEQALLHLTGSTVRDKRSTVMGILKYLVKVARKVIFLDADMSLTSYNYLKNIVGSDNIQVIVNAHKPAQKTFVRYSKRAAVHDLIKTRLAAGERLFITTNSRKAAKTLSKMLKTIFPDLTGWTLHSETVSKDEQEKIAHINQVISAYDYVIASPTIGTGVSIDVEDIDTVVLLGEAGVNTHQDMMQQAARVRTPRTGQVHCWIDSRRRQLPTDPGQIKEWAIKNIEETGLAIEIDADTHQRIAGRQEQEYLDLLADIYAARNASWTDLRANFWQQVELEGHQVELAGDEVTVKGQFSEAAEAYREARLELKDERAAGVLAAGDISDLAYKTLKEKAYLKEEERLQMQRHSLQRFYGPGLPVEPALIEDDEETRLRPKLVNWLALSQEGYALERDKAEFLEQPGRERRMLGDAKHLKIKTALRQEILEAAGLMGNLDNFLAVFNAGTLKARDFDTWATANQERIDRLLGIKVITAQSLVRLVTSTLGQLGLEPACRQYRTGEKYEDPDTGRIKEIREREYRVDRTRFDRVRELALAHLAAVRNSKAAWVEEEDFEKMRMAA
jgi:hypothetical protein